jgi:RES domain-containing protein
MPSPTDLIEAVDRVGTTTWSGTAYRFSRPSRAPLSGQGAYKFGGRWNPREGFPCIYLAEPREACIAEFYRRAEGQAHGAASLLPQTLHTIEVAGLRALDLTADVALTAVGLTIDDIRDDDRSACQAVAEAAHFLGYQGIRAPSATGTGYVVAVFEGHLEPGQVAVVASEGLDLG